MTQPVPEPFGSDAEEQGYLFEIQRIQRETGRKKAAEDWSRENPDDPSPGSMTRGAYSRGVGWLTEHVPDRARHVGVPARLPRFLGNRQLILTAWFAAMVLVAVDEWHSHGWFARPARLWSVSAVYAGLALLSQIDSMVPLCNILAIGYDVALGYEYYSGGVPSTSGFQFPGAQTGSSTGAVAGASPAATGTALAPGVVSAAQARTAASTTGGM